MNYSQVRTLFEQGKASFRLQNSQAFFYALYSKWIFSKCKVCEHHICPHSHPRPRYFVCLLERSSPRQEIRTGSVFCSVGFVGKGTFVHTATKSGTDTNPKGVDTRSRSEGRSFVLLQKQVRKNR